MPRYVINVTQERTETAPVEVMANSFEQAMELACAAARAAPDKFEWVVADGPCCDPYVADDSPEEHEVP